MASFSRRDLLLVALFFTLSIGTLGKECFIERIINLGDSLSDTGNRVREPGAFTLVNQKFPPYGESIPEGPTGRCSDGLLIIDHIAKGLGLPRLPAYLDESAKFDHGVNFAVAGATALNPKRLEALGIHLSYTRSSLEVQLSWFNNYLLVACPSYPDCSEHLEKTLFLVGEIGGNDYNFALTQNKPTNQVMLLVPMVVDMIMNTAQSIIDNGAKNLVIPGNFPIGCFPIHLTFFENTRALDNFGCISELNDFSKFHNEYLQFSIRDLRRKNPNVSIEYADYYYSTLKMIRNPSAYGFQEGSQFQACCGIGGAYNYNRTLGCTKGVPVCSDPSKSISWDGVHLTQAAYAVIANQLFSNVELFNQWKCTDA